MCALVTYIWFSSHHQSMLLYNPFCCHPLYCRPLSCRYQLHHYQQHHSCHYYYCHHHHPYLHFGHYIFTAIAVVIIIRTIDSQKTELDC